MNTLGKRVSLSRAPARRRGQALIEFSLCLPLLAAAFAGILDLGYLLWVDHTITAAVREGAVLGSTLAQSSVAWGDGDNQAVVRAYVVDVGRGTGLKACEVDVSTATVGGREALRITVNHEHALLTPFNFRGKTTFRLSRSFSCCFIGNVTPDGVW